MSYTSRCPWCHLNLRCLKAVRTLKSVWKNYNYLLGRCQSVIPACFFFFFFWRVSNLLQNQGISVFIMMYDTKSFHIWQWDEAITLEPLTCYPSHHYASLMGSLRKVNGLHAVSKQLFHSERYMHYKLNLTRNLVEIQEHRKSHQFRLMSFERFYSEAER